MKLLWISVSTILFFLCFLSGSIEAQTIAPTERKANLLQPIPVVLEGDPIALLDRESFVMYVNWAKIGNGGTWFVDVSTDHPEYALREALLRDGKLFAQSSLSMTACGGVMASGSFLKSLSVVDKENYVWTHPSLGGSGDVIKGDCCLFRTSGPVPEFLPPDSMFLRFGPPKMNRFGMVLVQALVRLPDGKYVTTLFFVKDDGEEARSVQEIFTSAPSARGESAISCYSMNDRGDVLFCAKTESRTWQVLLYDQFHGRFSVLAEAQGQSPVEGVRWSFGVDGYSPFFMTQINNRQEISFLGALEDGRTALVKNGHVLFLEGDIFPVPFHSRDAIESIRAAYLLDQDPGGMILLFETDNPDVNKDAGILLITAQGEKRWLVIEGVTQVDGEFLTIPYGSGMNLSTDEKHMILVGVLGDQGTGVEGAFRFELFP